MRFIQLFIKKFQTLGHYAVLAGLCWLLDFLVFLLLVHGAGVHPFWSNLLSSICGASAAYHLISRRIFNAKGGFRWHKWFVFVGYTLVVIFIWSSIITALIAMGMWPALAKCMVLPLSFYTNFLFMGWLQEGRVRWH